MRSCARRATCNCAVAVKAGDDVIVVDRCGAERGNRVDVPMTVTAYLNNELTSGTKVYQYKGGDEYRVSYSSKVHFRQCNGYIYVHACMQSRRIIAHLFLVSFSLLLRVEALCCIPA